MGQQAFKENDEIEVKVRDAFLPAMELVGADLDEFKAGAYECWVLGQVLAALNASPLADQVSEDTFKKSFYAVHEYFTRPGTFEFYLDICRVIWGDAVDVEFVIPNPGHLQINIEAAEGVAADFLARDIVDNAYVYDEVIDDEGDNIAFQVTQGLKSESEVDALFSELSPAGIFVEATVTTI